MWRMGIVVIEQLVESPETLWLKMLGNKQSAQRAFREIEQLSPNRREKNDTIRASLKYCVYLKELPRESLSEEEREFMKTMAQVDAWYDAEIAKAELQGEQRGKLQGKIESASKIVRAKFGVESLTPQIVSQLEGLTDRQLDEFMVGMFNWQQPTDMAGWLSDVKSDN